MRSINRITQFFSSKEAVSRDVALQTAAALQVRITLYSCCQSRLAYPRYDDIFTLHGSFSLQY